MHDIAMTVKTPVPPGRPLLVLIAGPYLSGTGGDPVKIARKRARLESFALRICERGHLPIIHGARAGTGPAGVPVGRRAPAP